VGGTTYDRIQLQSNCRFQAAGDVDREAVKQLIEVWGKVVVAGCTPVLKQGTVQSNGYSWYIDDVGPCNILASAQPNMLHVQIVYIDADTMMQSTSTFEKQPFVAVGTYSNCYYYTQGGAARSNPLTTALPRYYRMTCRLHEGASDDLVLVSGGLIQSNSLYLSYCTERSTPYEAFWQSASHETGKWHLRVHSTGNCSMAEISLQRVGERIVRPSLVFSTFCWNHRGRSIFAAQRPAEDPLLGKMVLEVEPA
jgi:hypothetical protein